jgi:hypothetical protein
MCWNEQIRTSISIVVLSMPCNVVVSDVKDVVAMASYASWKWAHFCNPQTQYVARNSSEFSDSTGVGQVAASCIS